MHKIWGIMVPCCGVIFEESSVSIKDCINRFFRTLGIEPLHMTLNAGNCGVYELKDPTKNSYLEDRIKHVVNCNENGSISCRSRQKIKDQFIKQSGLVEERATISEEDNWYRFGLTETERIKRNL